MRCIMVSMVAVCMMTFTATVSFARPHQWTYARIAENADVIVIGHVESTRDRDVDIGRDPLWKRLLDDRSIAKDIDGTVRGKVVRFRVEAVIKGKWTAETIDAVYLAPSKEPNIIVNGPTLVDFKVDKNASFLVFLKVVGGDAAEPVSGLFDPAYSFRRLPGGAGD